MLYDLQDSEKKSGLLTQVNLFCNNFLSQLLNNRTSYRIAEQNYETVNVFATATHQRNKKWQSSVIRGSRRIHRQRSSN